MKYWLMKSEPNEYSINDLKSDPKGWEHWDGVRNYQARNFMREMRKKDQVMFYHSNTDVPGVVGIATVCKEAYPDHTAFDPKDKHFDPKSDPDNPRWFMVDVKFKRKLKRTISLRQIKEHADKLEDLALIRRGNRLSIMPLTKRQWDYILRLGKS